MGDIIKGWISRNSLILVYTIHPPTVHVWTKFQLCRPYSSWEKCAKNVSKKKVYKHTNIFTEKTKTISSLYTLYSGGIIKHWVYCEYYFNGISLLFYRSVSIFLRSLKPTVAQLLSLSWDNTVNNQSTECTVSTTLMASLLFCSTAVWASSSGP